MRRALRAVWIACTGETPTLLLQLRLPLLFVGALQVTNGALRFAACCCLCEIVLTLADVTGTSPFACGQLGSV